MVTILTARLTPEEGYTPIPTIACTLGEAAMYEPEGVYTVASTFNHDQVLLFDAHLDRLEESARLEQIPLKLDRAGLRAALRHMLDESGYPDARFRITVERARPSHLYLAMERLNPVPASLREQGVSVATIRAARPNPAAKTTDWMNQRLDVTADLAPQIYEAILRSEQGELLEGASSNFYAILGGRLYTAPENRVLNGIARRVLLASAEGLLPIQLQPVSLDMLPQLSDAFLTSASRGVIPIVEMDGQPIADGRPGELTRQLQERYDAWAAAHLESL